jgi:hypothetical protein
MADEPKPSPEVHEVVYSPLFVKRGTMYRVDRGLYVPGRCVALVFHDEADYQRYLDHPELWERPESVQS